VNNSEMDIQESVGEEGVDWIDLSQYRDKRRAFVSAVMSPWVS